MFEEAEKWDEEEDLDEENWEEETEEEQNCYLKCIQRFFNSSSFLQDLARASFSPSAFL